MPPLHKDQLVVCHMIAPYVNSFPLASYTKWIVKFRFCPIFLFLLFINFQTVLGQTKDLILTKEQNNKWLDSLKTISLDVQLLIIQNRILSDTNVYVRQFYADRINIIDSLGDRIYGDGKPTLIIDG
jgi:hypothetical protein